MAELKPSEKCARCGRLAPGPAGLAGRFDGTSASELMLGDGWATFAEEPTLRIMVPYPGPAMLPAEVLKAIREFEGAVDIDPDPHTRIAVVGEVDTTLAGLACPECRVETGWDAGEWYRFLWEQRLGLSGGGDA